MKIKILFVFLTLLPFSLCSQAILYATKENIPYYSTTTKSDSYQKERCVLDIYYPTNRTNFATIVWFHGGGLTGGEKEIPEALKNKGYAILAVNYRLAPKVTANKCIDDAAAAVAWAFNTIKSYGGDTSKIFVAGHSAGGYLTAMLGLDKKYLQNFGIDANKIAGLIPFSGQCITHFEIRHERGLADTTPVIDSMAPLYHVREDAPPLLLMTGDRELEMLGRYEENAYMARMMKLVGHKETKLYEFGGYGHGMTEPGFPILLKEVARICQEKK